MLPQRICVECGEIHALLKCPKCGCRQHEPITDAMTLALLAKNDRIAELEAALKWAWDNLKLEVDYPDPEVGFGYCASCNKPDYDHAENCEGLKRKAEAARLLDGDK